MLVLGLGESGLAMARWCARWGARVSVADSRDNPPHAHTLRRELPQVQLRQGVAAEVLGDARLVLKSPGLSPRDEALQPLLAAARERGVDVQGELYLFARALEDLRAEREYAPAVLAITGQSALLQHNPRLAQSVRLRLPYIDPLNVLQVELLRRHRAGGADDDIRRGIHMSINGVSAGLRNSG